MTKPAKPPLTERAQIRVSRFEVSRWVRAATKQNRSLSNWARHVLNIASDDTLKPK